MFRRLMIPGLMISRFLAGRLMIATGDWRKLLAWVAASGMHRFEGPKLGMMDRRSCFETGSHMTRFGFRCRRVLIDPETLPVPATIHTNRRHLLPRVFNHQDVIPDNKHSKFYTFNLTM